MKQPYGIGLLLLAMTLLLVTFGITTSFGAGLLYLLEVGILLIIQLLIFVMLFSERDWNYSHAALLIIGAVTVAFLFRAVLFGSSNLEILMLIALSLAGFVIVVMDKPTKRPVMAAKSQTRLDTYDPIQTYDLNNTNYFEPTVRMTQVVKKKRGRPKGSTKKTAKKTVKKTAGKSAKKASKSAEKKVSKTGRPRGRPKGSKNKK